MSLEERIGGSMRRQFKCCSIGGELFTHNGLHVVVLTRSLPNPVGVIPVPTLRFI